jgi:hypothetical protein
LVSIHGDLAFDSVVRQHIERGVGASGRASCSLHNREANIERRDWGPNPPKGILRYGWKSSNEAPPLKGSTTSQYCQAEDQAFDTRSSEDIPDPNYNNMCYV